MGSVWIRVKSPEPLIYEVLDHLKAFDVRSLYDQTGQLKSIGDTVLGRSDASRIIWGRNFCTGYYYAIKESTFVFDSFDVQTLVSREKGQQSKLIVNNQVRQWLSRVKQEAVAFDLIPKWSADGQITSFDPFVRGYGFAALQAPKAEASSISGYVAKTYMVMDIAAGVNLKDFLNSNTKEIRMRVQDNPVTPENVFATSKYAGYVNHCSLVDLGGSFVTFCKRHPS